MALDSRCWYGAGITSDARRKQFKQDERFRFAMFQWFGRCSDRTKGIRLALARSVLAGGSSLLASLLRLRAKRSCPHYPSWIDPKETSLRTSSSRARKPFLFQIWKAVTPRALNLVAYVKERGRYTATDRSDSHSKSIFSREFSAWAVCAASMADSATRGPTHAASSTRCSLAITLIVSGSSLSLSTRKSSRNSGRMASPAAVIRSSGALSAFSASRDAMPSSRRLRTCKSTKGRLARKLR